MDEQRLQEYLKLIGLLWQCSDEEEAEILQAHADLVDLGLLLTMQRVAEDLSEQGNTNAAEWLQNLAGQLAEAVGLTEESVAGEMPSQETLWFLAEVLQCIAETSGEAAQVYPFLAAHQEKLNTQLLQALPVGFAMFLQGDEEQSLFVAAIFFEFGNLIAQFPLGNRALNLEMAIAAYQLALQVRTREAFPVDWAATQNNLANAYSERIQGDRAENLEQAIAAFQLALQVYTREAFPVDWAMTQNNLATAYSDRIQGDRAENLEQAIAAYQLALQIRTPTAFPQDCLQTGRSLGNLAFKEGRWSLAIEGYGVAIAAVEQSRSWAADETRRQEIQSQASDIYEKMVQACINNGQLDKALETVERSRSKRLVDLMASNDLYQDGNIPSEVQIYLQNYEHLQHRINQIRFGHESSENRPLAGTATTRNRTSWEAENELIQKLETQKQQVRQQLSRLDPVSAGLLQVSAPNLAAMQRLIDQPTTALLSFFSTSENTYIFVLRTDQITCHTCPGQGIEKLQNWLIEEWLKPYLAINQTRDDTERIQRRATWSNRIPTILGELSQRLQFNELLQTHLPGVRELILVPHLFLHQIPFAALPTDNGFLGDLFHLRYVPSCQVLEFCQQRPPVTQLQYGTVEDATEDLPCANFEGEQVAQLYNIPPAQRLRGRNYAKVENYRKLAEQVQVILSSHHAQSRLDNPLESMLVLADGAITLGQLLTPAWRLPQLSDVFLSCCETGLGLTPDLTDDILTLGTGFLCAGARSVVSTLWSVDDLATAIFSILYHEYRHILNRPAALQKAQQELQQMTGAELTNRYKQELIDLLDEKYEQSEALRQEAEAKMNQHQPDTQEYKDCENEHNLWAKSATRIEDTTSRLKALCREKKPFNHPVFWAAFVCQGLR
ncbi:CHAT domain-containing protein [Floridanema evergladense]|uniref:CHAT domain-containing protein n=1 Tax=Floridaenema evergladense BLCC-F167 TaxID=3153639 RepID=A0ABV4WQT9_9CYAN